MTDTNRTGTDARLDRRSYLKAIGAGSALSFGSGVAGATASTTDYIYVPHGKRVRKENVIAHEGPNRDVSPGDVATTRTQSETVTTQKRPVVPDVHQWLAYTYAAYNSNDGNGFKRYQGYFVVPESPPVSGNVNFLFPAFQDENDTTIVQPVLQWNWGSYTDRWTYAAWWGPDSSGAYHHGPVMAADPGDALFGYMNVDNSNGGQWYIELQNQTKGTSSDIDTDYLTLDFTHAFTTLEVAGYNWGGCDQLPGYTTFYQQSYENFAGQGVTVNWSEIVNSNAQCNVNPEVSSSSKTTIYTS
ncbi:hypothetical protein [Haladaptatus sp. DYF46]|uniref:hypothetical protein n=1 Tax=unclassified Haladaptatus TaxID=2622732 RepID=UPI001E37B6D3|nr:hypothetical protein [Haladaptatus sp. DYF46]